MILVFLQLSTNSDWVLHELTEIIQDLLSMGVNAFSEFDMYLLDCDMFFYVKIVKFGKHAFFIFLVMYFIEWFVLRILSQTYQIVVDSAF